MKGKYKIEPCFYTKTNGISRLNKKGKYDMLFAGLSIKEANWYLKNPEAIEQKHYSNKLTGLVILLFIMVLIMVMILTLK